MAGSSAGPAPMAEPLLTVEHLRKSFGALAATDDLSLEVVPGEIHAVIGPNGAGKTTFISQLFGELEPDSGRILFRGEDIAGEPVHERAPIAASRAPIRSPRSIWASARSTTSRMAIQARAGHSFRFWRNARKDASLRDPARAALAKVGLAGRADVPARVLAHGERRQLELAMALATAPALLLLDEPMAGMGPEESQRMVEVLLALKGQVTMLLVEHDMDAVFALADRITVLVYGRAIATGTPEEIRRNAEVREAYLGAERMMLAVEGLETYYGPSQALFGVDFEIEAGEVATLMGRNGMGKTTTIHSIMGLIPLGRRSASRSRVGRSAACRAIASRAAAWAWCPRAARYSPSSPCART